MPVCQARARVAPARAPTRRSVFPGGIRTGLRALAGLAAGVGIGMLRIALGRHYPSDVIFSGVFVLLTAAILYRLMIREAIRPNERRGCENAT